MAISLVIACALALFHPAPPDRRVLMPFDYQGVRIEDGLIRKQLDEAKEFYLRIPNDDLLLGFRRRAGKPAPGVELGGWYSDDVFHIFGQILSGLSRLYAATGDPACRAKAEALYEGWRSCIRPGGFFYYSNHPNAPHYIFDKMAGGLVDLAIYCQRRDALESLATITRWAESHLDRTRPYGRDGSEWYTLSENLYRAYLLTGDPTYRDFAKVWEYTPYWNLYAKNLDIFSVGGWVGRPITELASESSRRASNVAFGYHAYSHVNTLGGATLAYRVSGQAHYLDTIRNAFDYLQSHECFATGGYGPDESLLPQGQVANRLRTTDATFETQCGTWAVFKLCKSLISLTGDAKYGDWIERTAYNGICATIPETPDGKVLYYSDYNPDGAVKFNHADGWSCCAGTRPMAIADVDDLIYFKAPDGLDVNLFVPSTVTFTAGNEPVHVRQETRFPESTATEFRISLNHPRLFAFRIRSASWFNGKPSALLNGSPVPLTAEANHWLGLRRTWHDGDRLQIALPMAARRVPLMPYTLYPSAVAVGPVVLAFRAPTTNPANDLDRRQLGSELVPSPGEPLTYHLRHRPEVLARPFYAFKEGEPYYLYLDPEAVGRVTYRRMRRGGQWHDSGHFWFSNQPGAWCECDFEGRQFKLVGWAFDDGGKAEVRIDGKLVGEIDQYGAGRDLPFDYRLEGLSPRRHTIRITVTGRHEAASRDCFINVGGIQASEK